MTAPGLLATSTTVLRHAVRLIHASTGDPVPGISARLAAPVPGWTVRTTGGTAVVTARADLPAPAGTPELLVTVTDPAAALLLGLGAAPGHEPGTVVVPLGAESIDVPVHPVPMVLEVLLSTATDGTPRTGATVAARATAGPTPRPTLSLTETAPGTYRTAAAEFTAAFTPLDLLVGAQPLRTLAVDFTAPLTRIRLVDTT